MQGDTGAREDPLVWLAGIRNLGVRRLWICTNSSLETGHTAGHQVCGQHKQFKVPCAKNEICTQGQYVGTASIKNTLAQTLVSPDSECSCPS